jgi:hypothetical protein
MRLNQGLRGQRLLNKLLNPLQQPEITCVDFTHFSFVVCHVRDLGIVTVVRRRNYFEVINDRWDELRCRYIWCDLM